MSTRPSRRETIIVRIALFLGCLFSLGGFMLLLGYLTGVIAMCSSAPSWWQATYFCSLFVGVPWLSAFIARSLTSSGSSAAN